MGWYRNAYNATKRVRTIEEWKSGGIDTESLFKSYPSWKKDVIFTYGECSEIKIVHVPPGVKVFVPSGSSDDEDDEMVILINNKFELIHLGPCDQVKPEKESELATKKMNPYNAFMKEELARLKEGKTNIDHKAIFKQAAANWKNREAIKKGKAKVVVDDSSDDEDYQDWKKKSTKKQVRVDSPSKGTPNWTSECLLSHSLSDIEKTNRKISPVIDSPSEESTSDEEEAPPKIKAKSGVELNKKPSKKYKFIQLKEIKSIFDSEKILINYAIFDHFPIVDVVQDGKTDTKCFDIQHLKNGFLIEDVSPFTFVRLIKNLTMFYKNKLSFSMIQDIRTEKIGNLEIEIWSFVW